MHLRGTDFGHCFDMSGVRGFFGEGYPYHKLFKNYGLTFEGSTFVAKTTTLHARKGNMPMKADGITPAEYYPSCIKVYLLKGVALNAVGLSGPGAENLLRRQIWQDLRSPFLLSYMSLAATPANRIDELRQFVDLLGCYLGDFKAKVGLQINFSCPNVSVDHGTYDELVGEILVSLTIASDLKIPLIPKLNVLIPPESALEITVHPNCDALCLSNTIPYGQLPDKIDWKALFGEKSPLAKYGGGGLSGSPLLPLVDVWLCDARTIGIEKPIIAGGGILHGRDAYRLARAGASAVAVGSMSMLRPWRMQATIDRVNKLGRDNIFWPDSSREFLSQVK